MSLKPDELAEDLPERIRELRAHLRLTQKEFADVWGTGEKQPGAWERGEQLPKPASIERACRKNNWPVEIFMKGGRRPPEVVNAPLTVSDVGSLRERPAPNFYRLLDPRKHAPMAFYSGAISELQEYEDRRALMPPGLIRQWFRQLYEAGKIAGRMEGRGLSDADIPPEDLSDRAG